MRRLWFFLFLLVASIGIAYLLVPKVREDVVSQVSYPVGSIPDPALTPGDVRPDATVEELCSTTTKAFRHVTSARKREVYRRYGMMNNHSFWCDTPEACEIDHDLPLELGGSNEITNLWPQSYAGTWNAHMKDRLENTLHDMVCDHKIDLPTAQKAITTDWIAAYKKYVQ